MIILCDKCKKPVEIVETVYDVIRQAAILRIKCHGVEGTVTIPDFEQPGIVVFKEK